MASLVSLHFGLQISVKTFCVVFELKIEEKIPINKNLEKIQTFMVSIEIEVLLNWQCSVFYGDCSILLFSLKCGFMGCL